LGVYLAPEVGYIDYMDNVAGNDQGYEWYAAPSGRSISDLTKH
jgi:hypothetical protein